MLVEYIASLGGPPPEGNKTQFAIVSVSVAVAVALCGALAPGASMCGQKTRVRQIETDRSISACCLSGDRISCSQLCLLVVCLFFLSAASLFRSQRGFPPLVSQRRLALSVSAGLPAIGINVIC